MATIQDVYHIRVCRVLYLLLGILTATQRIHSRRRRSMRCRNSNTSIRDRQDPVPYDQHPKSSPTHLLTLAQHATTRRTATQIRRSQNVSRSLSRRLSNRAQRGPARDLSRHRRRLHLPDDPQRMSSRLLRADPLPTHTRPVLRLHHPIPRRKHIFRCNEWNIGSSGWQSFLFGEDTVTEL